jgi:protein involved in polysaccharide export with SLBB domain
LLLLAMALAFEAGCATGRPQFERALLANPAASAGRAAPEQDYRIHCPDVLEIQGSGLQGSALHAVGADGRIDVGDGTRLRVDGRTTAEVAEAIADCSGVGTAQVRVRVAQFNSQQVYVFGEVAGLQRALPYQGPESVLDLLRRAGGITPGAAPGDVQVVRAHVAEGKTPEIFHIDLEAIVLQKDAHTNITLEPFDQVYIGQSQRSRFCPCLPPWLRPTYEALCGLRRPQPT